MEASSATQETDRATPVEVDLLRTRAPSAQPTPRIGFRTQAERERVLGWLSAGLREGRTDRLMGELPLIFSAETTAHHLWLQDDEAPICFATLWPVCFRIGEASLRAGLVSNVFTDPSRQHEGLASALLRRALGLAEAEALGLVLLWSELEELYAPLGFDRAGDESLILVDRFVLQRAAEALAPPTGQTVVPATAGDWEEIERLRHLRTCELRLPVGLISAYRDVPDLDVRVARDGTGVQGFAIRGRGDDLKEVIHEWGGAPSSGGRALRPRPAGPRRALLGTAPGGCTRHPAAAGLDADRRGGRLRAGPRTDPWRAGGARGRAARG